MHTPTELTAAATLGVRPDADHATVRRAWRAVAAVHHPDRGGDPALFRRATAARDVLLSRPGSHAGAPARGRAGTAPAAPWDPSVRVIRAYRWDAEAVAV